MKRPFASIVRLPDAIIELIDRSLVVQLPQDIVESPTDIKVLSLGVSGEVELICSVTVAPKIRNWEILLPEDLPHGNLQVYVETKGLKQMKFLKYY